MKQGWEYKKLGEVCTIERGGSPRPITDYITDSEDGINWIKIGDAQEGSKYITSTKEKIRPEGIKKSRFVHKGDFILSNSMSFGRPYILKMDGCIHDGWLVIHDDNEVFIKDYLYYILSSSIMYAKFSQLAVGGVVNNLNSSLVRKVAIPIPPKSTQLSIVSELDKINELIRLKKEQLKDYDNLAQSIFYEMFGDPVENEKGWEVSTYSKCFNIGSGGTPSKSVPEYWDNGNIPWIGSNMCQNCIITETDGKFITQEGLNNSSTKYLEVGTVLVALVGATIGKVALLRTPTCTNQNVAFIKANESKDFVPEYVFYNLMGQYEEFMKIGKGDFKMANQAFIKALPILFPPLSLQHLFAQRIEKIEHQKSEVAKAITDLETLLASRMQHWFE